MFVHRRCPSSSQEYTYSPHAAIPEEDAEKLTTVGKVIDYLKSKGFGDGAQA